MGWGSVLGSVGSAIGGSVGDILHANSGSSKAKREAQRQRDWQTYMSNTAHQREVKDLIAAGLNPVLTATGGSGAPVGSSGLATPAVAHGAFSNGVSNAVKGWQASMQRDLTDAQVSNLSSASSKNEADAAAARVMAQNNATLLPEMVQVQRAQASMYNAQAMSAMQNAALTRLALPQAAANAGMYNSWYGQSLPYINSALGIANGVVGVAKPFTGNGITETTYYNGNGEITGGSRVRRTGGATYHLY